MVKETPKSVIGLFVTGRGGAPNTVVSVRMLGLPATDNLSVASVSPPSSFQYNIML